MSIFKELDQTRDRTSLLFASNKSMAASIHDFIRTHPDNVFDLALLQESTGLSPKPRGAKRLLILSTNLRRNSQT